MNTFTAKQLRITFVLSGSSMFSNGKNTVVITGLWISAQIQSMQCPAFPQADIDVWGMLAQDMNTLTDFENHQLAVTRNTVILEANAGAGWTTVFAGQIISAQPNYGGAPDVPLHIKGRVMGYESIESTSPTSYTGSTSVATIVSNLAARIRSGFENDGVTATLANPYFPGTIGDQLTAVAQHANISIFYDYGPAGQAYANQPPVSIIITPKGLPRSTPTITLTPQSGLVGYPTIDSVGWVFARSYYNAGLKFGGQVTISGSDLPRANATWQILQLNHSLSTTPDGPWFSDMQLMATGAFPYPQ